MGRSYGPSGSNGSNGSNESHWFQKANAVGTNGSTGFIDRWIQKIPCIQLVQRNIWIQCIRINCHHGSSGSNGPNDGLNAQHGLIVMANQISHGAVRLHCVVVPFQKELGQALARIALWPIWLELHTLDAVFQSFKIPFQGRVAC